MKTGENPIRIVADDRERASGVIDALVEREGEVQLEVKRLQTGDYRVEDRIVIERKTANDFVRSLIDARLFRQVGALVSCGGRGVLILEGTFGARQPGSMSRESLQGAMITISVFYGVAVLRSIDAVETARLLVYLARQSRRFAQNALPRAGTRPKGKRSRQLFLLQGLPGIGPERAGRLLDRFGSIEAVVRASAADLAEVDSIGGLTAARIRWAVEEPPEA